MQPRAGGHGAGTSLQLLLGTVSAGCAVLLIYTNGACPEGAVNCLGGSSSGFHEPTSHCEARNAVPNEGVEGLSNDLGHLYAGLLIRFLQREPDRTQLRDVGHEVCLAERLGNIDRLDVDSVPATRLENAPDAIRV